MSADEARIELQTYERSLADLLPGHDGQFVVIRGDKIEKFFADYASALDWAYNTFGVERFFVKQIAANRDVAHFTRDLVPTITGQIHGGASHR